MSTLTTERVALESFSVESDGDGSVQVERDDDLRQKLSRGGITAAKNAENGVVLIALNIDGCAYDVAVLDTPGGPANKTSVETLRRARKAIDLALTAYE